MHALAASCRRPKPSSGSVAPAPPARSLVLCPAHPVQRPPHRLAQAKGAHDDSKPRSEEADEAPGEGQLVQHGVGEAAIHLRGGGVTGVEPWGVLGRVVLKRIGAG